jgi:hypothetical protein
VVNVTPQLCLTPGKGPRYTLDRGLGGPQSWSGHRGYRTNLFASAKDRTSIARSSFPLSDTILTELPRLLCAYTETEFSAPLVIYASSFHCFRRAIIHTHRENNSVFSGESCSFCREPANDSSNEVYRCTHCTYSRDLSSFNVNPNDFTSVRLNKTGSEILKQSLHGVQITAKSKRLEPRQKKTSDYLKFS